MKTFCSGMMNVYFIGYHEKSKQYRFYWPNNSTRIVETGNAKFIENGEIRGSNEPQEEIIQVRIQVLLPITSKEIIVPIVVEQQMNDEPLHTEIVTNKEVVVMS